jgi:hypothetical protein
MSLGTEAMTTRKRRQNGGFLQMAAGIAAATIFLGLWIGEQNAKIAKILTTTTV